MPAYLYWGEEDFNLENAVNDLRKSVLAEGFSALSHKKLNEPEIRDLIEALQTLPMMFGNLLVEVNAQNLFLRGNKKLDSDDERMKKLFDALENLNERVHLLFICPISRDSGKKVDGTLKITKILQKIGKVQEFPAFKFYEDYKAIDWIVKQAESKSLKISKETATLLLANAGMDLRKLDSELNKINTAIYPRKQITVDDLKEMVSTNENIFLLLELWMKEQKTLAIKELYKLFERNNPLKILATLQTMTGRWLKLKVLSKYNNTFDLAKLVNSPEFTVKKDLERLKNISEEKLVELRNKAVESEYKIKSGLLSPEIALEILIAG